MVWRRNFNKWLLLPPNIAFKSFVLFIYPHEQPFTSLAFGVGYFGQDGGIWRQEGSREASSCYSQKLIQFSGLSVHFLQQCVSSLFPQESRQDLAVPPIGAENDAIYILISGLFTRMSHGINFR